MSVKVWLMVGVIVAALLPAHPPLAAASAADDEAPPSEEGGETAGSGKEANLPIPRFVSLRTNPINLRTGPGVRYPVEWIYMRRYLPVEIVGQFDTWRRIRDHDGAEGWVHQSLLSGRHTGIVTGQARSLHRGSDETSAVVAVLEPGVIVNVELCQPQAADCRVEVNGREGWLKRDQFWGVYPGEPVQ